MIISRLRSEWAYISGRLAALISRPLMLLAVNHWAGNEPASKVAVIFLVTLLATTASAFDTHRSFYKSYFGDRPSKGLRNDYRTYFASIFLQIAIVLPILFIFIVYRFDDLTFALLVIAYFASERLTDESQRFLIFAQRRMEWGVRIMAKAGLQILGVTASAVFSDNPAQMSILFLVIGNLLAFGSKVERRHLPACSEDWSKAFNICVQQRLFWLLSGLSAFAPYSDRLAVMMFKQSEMAVYTILVSSMGLIQNCVEYFFISIKRLEILKGSISLKDILKDKYIYIIITLSSILSSIMSVIMIYIYHKGEIVNAHIIPLILIGQIALAFSMILREMIYWSHRVSTLINIELTFILFVLLSYMVVYFFEMQYEFVIAQISILLIFRLIFMTWKVFQEIENECSNEA